VQPQIEQHVLARLPIPGLDSDEKHEIIACAKQLKEMYSQIDASLLRSREILGMYEQIEHAVCMLYRRVLRTASGVYSG
jgi:glutamine phosphoribosylpyrophosphate amidotransferase